MERKYYLRGLGIGIIVTAIIMGIVTSRNQTMTNQEIIARAKELGMVENTVLADIDDEAAAEGTDNEESDADIADVSGMAEPAAAAESGQDTEDVLEGETGENIDGMNDNQSEDDVQAGESEADVDSDKQPVGEETAGTNDDEDAEEENEEAEGNPDVNQDTENAREIITSAAVKTITINSGDGSHTVAKKLADVGVVTSADTFDDFLCRNGYDKRLRTGTFSIPADASDEQIARIVTGAE